MKIRIIVCYEPRYRRGHRFHFVPPVTGIHLAAITPPEHEVEVFHQQVRPVPVDASPDLVALSFFSGFAKAAYALADRYRALGVPRRRRRSARHVLDGGGIGACGRRRYRRGGERLAANCSATLSAAVWAASIAAVPHRWTALPTPRYDLLEKRFIVPRVIQATRGCPFSCSFCSVPDLNPGFRVRPVADIVRDIAETHFPHFWQEKVAWFWDDNLLVQRRWAKELLRELAGLGRWWLTQASIDIVKDRELLDLMERSGCIGIFLGIESLDDADLRSVGKRQNRAGEYKDAIERLHDRGICVMAGFISGFDNQTPETILATAGAAQRDRCRCPVP